MRRLEPSRTTPSLARQRGRRHAARLGGRLSVRRMPVSRCDLHQPLHKHELARRIVAGASALVGAALTAFAAALLAGQCFGS